ncbi:asparagine synthase (glutamine-hydrolyzing) [Streptomyces lunaelactis]|uniref:asparagine synthase (glutamine-hydrolyzing) n=1 Tax=Streptomyces lunaelactis TaxID=1535768 RepID=UPI0015850894|nr:asparagine synthase (glutamine-hydrolyzing) [Streptomyces lunaelactis]NUK00662.1 asparagine synthase (glutamine-hydrolyzing) [Streptomyces lunaelactis]NUK14382.1 asparagine synthase (glutamine-hydrolyzing) [Streptomyces lunaelactis]NUK33467.1 asparagine synthase (glutamine-hydrolyzing) [Streptomyces lunaelactis]NUK39911.1 asparagine synthase (glutamine-hydrolyzing) [Streptomyces lunaelactis]NUK49212.1 asparagine synthase (glutamine-hydrolyzing) [Streptomyces lunaelactis]
MCGIAGWVDFERGLREEASTVRTMVGTLANRGPDAEAVWTDERAALGHRRLAVIDVDGSPQPMVAEEDGRTLAVLVHNGEIYNFHQVRAQLESLGHRFRTAGDTEVVLRAYLEWGERCAERLEGMFAFAVWDPRAGKLVMVRDRLGIKPLYYAAAGRGLVFGSEPKALLAHPSIECVVDTEGLAELLAYIATPGHAVYRGMREVPAGHVTVVRDGSVTESRYWTLPNHEHPDDLATTIDTVRGLLQEAVASHLVSDVPLCTLLSGGVDSSAIAAFAAQSVTDGRRPKTFAVDFEGHTERFRKDFWHEDPDAPYAAEVARHVGTDHEPVVLRTSDLADPVVDAAALRAQDLPRPIPDMDRSLYLLLRSVRQRSTVALMGEVADELFGGYQSFRDPTLVDTANFPWVTMGLRVAPHGMSTGLLDPGFLKKIDVPGYSAQRYSETVAEVPRVPGESDQEHTMRVVGHAHLSRWLPLLLSRDDRLSMAVGLELRVPYCDHRLVEYVYNIPWGMKTADGREKSVLRSAVADLLPASVTQRRKSPFPVTQDPRYGEVLRSRFNAVVGDPSSPVRPLLDSPACAELAKEDRPIAVDGWGERRNVEMVLQLDAWLRHYRVRLDI